MAHHPLPQKRRLLCIASRGNAAIGWRCRSSAAYQVNFQLEPVEPEVFWTFQQELAFSGERQGMLHHFNSSGRMAVARSATSMSRSAMAACCVQLFDTFPDDFAIVKSQCFTKYRKAGNYFSHKAL